MALSPYARYGVTAITGTTQVQRQHTVIAGDTIQKIAAFYNPKAGYDSEIWRQIAEANAIDDLDNLAVGTVLLIPSPAPSST